MTLTITDAMRRRIDAGIAWLYTPRDGRLYHIDSSLKLPYRQIDFAEAMYTAADEVGFYPRFPSLSLCQYALEEGCPQWRGVGWYWLGMNDGEAEWIDSLEVLKERVAELKPIARETGEGYWANYAGDGEEPVIIY